MEDPQDIEIQLLIEAVYHRWGYDFRAYSKAHIKRRVLHHLSKSGLESVSHLQHQILYNKNSFFEFFQDLSINTTEMFRDPLFFLSLREKVLPLLKDQAGFKIWHAGCASGEEVYSMAIMLLEEGLLDRCQIYATDFNPVTLKKAREAIYSLSEMKVNSSNYLKSGGKATLSDYYHARYNSAIMEKSLRDRIVFAEHNLVTDDVFGEMELVICRNTLIYFTKELQNRVLRLFYNSLGEGGFLCLGSKESLAFSDYQNVFDPFISKWKIYRRK